MIASNFRVGITGLGYVGLPLALRFADAGLPALGCDIDLEEVQTMGEGQSYIRYVGDQAVRYGHPAENVVRA